MFLHSFIGGKAKTDENHSLISNKTKHEFIRNAIIMSTAFARFLCFKRIIQGILQQVRADNQSRNKKKKKNRTFIAGGFRRLQLSLTCCEPTANKKCCLFFPRFVTGCFYEMFVSYIHVTENKIVFIL